LTNYIAEKRGDHIEVKVSGRAGQGIELNRETVVVVIDSKGQREVLRQRGLK
jgi:hypothetical protein